MDAFYKHPKMRDGRLNKCIECTKTDVKAHRLKNLEHYRSYDRQRGDMPHRVAARAAYRETVAFRLSHFVAVQKWSVMNPHKKRATTAVSNALRDGKLQRFPCFVCGNKAHAHHPAYSDPLAVAWLCRTHHAQLHREHRQQFRMAA